MTVTKIEGVSKSRYRVFIDGQFAFVIYKGELSRFHIRENGELPDADYQCIMQEILVKRAKLRCMHLLQTKDYTRKQLEDKLRQSEYPNHCIEQAIAYVESYGYVDDFRYAKSFIEYHMQNRSKSRIQTDLMRKGIAKGHIESAFKELADDGIVQDEMALIRNQIQKKHYDCKTATQKEKQKMYAFLLRKGFRTEAIARALSLDIISNSV